MATTAYARVLFAGPDLTEGSWAELFRRGLITERGADALPDLVDTTDGPAPLWERVRHCLAAGESPLLVIDLDPMTSSAHLDWLRAELQRIGHECEAADSIFVASPLDANSAASACAVIDQPARHLGCVEVPALPTSHAWSCIPAHEYRVLACNGPRCVRRGALPLWKHLRARLKASGKLECAGGVHITRTQCQFPCDLGPTLSVYPGGKWYRIRSEGEVDRLVDEVFISGGDASDLLQGQD